jgi:gas vesicle protein
MRITSTLAALSLAASIALLTGCEGGKSPTETLKAATDKATETAKDAGSSMAAAGQNLANQSMDSLKEAAGKIADQAGASDWAGKAVESVKAQVATLKEKAAAAPAAVKPQVDALIGQIDTQVAALSAKANELKGAGPEAWKKLLDESKPMIDKIKELIGQATAKLAG